MSEPYIYYQDEQATIWCGDCRDVLPTLEPVDLVLTDPPYGMKWDGRISSGSNSNSIPNARSWSFGQTIIGDDSPFDPTPWLSFPEVILWGANHFAMHLPVGTTLIWIKRYDDAFGSFLSDGEVAWMKGGHGVYCYRDAGYKTRENRHHPTQKPLALIHWCFTKTSGSTVLDPYMGSGTTLRAAKDLGRRAIGIEIEERYCEIAAKRLSQSVLNFDPPPQEPEIEGLFEVD